MSHAASLALLSGPPGPGELIIVFLVALVLFGPKRLPAIARSIGKAVHELRRAAHDFRDQVMSMDEHASPRRRDDGTDRGKEAAPEHAVEENNGQPEEDRHDLAG